MDSSDNFAGPIGGDSGDSAAMYGEQGASGRVLGANNNVDGVSQFYHIQSA